MPLYKRDEINSKSEEVSVTMPVDTKRAKMEIEIDEATAAIRLVREALYEMDYVWIPRDDDENKESKMKMLKVRLNYAKEASALLPDALKILTKYIGE